MMTVATLTRNVRLSKEIIRQCRNIIENSDLNPQDTNRSTDTLAEIFYRNGGFDEKINKRFSKSAIKKILTGGLVDDLTVREFLFFLEIIPCTEDDITQFIVHDSALGEDENPYPLSDKDIVFNGDQVSFSKAAVKEIKLCIKKKGLNQTFLAQQYNVSGSKISQKTINNAFAGNKCSKQIFAKILMALMEHEVIQLPEDQHLGQRLYPEAASSYTPTPETLNTAQNCAAVVGGGEIPALTALLQPSPQHT